MPELTETHFRVLAAVVLCTRLPNSCGPGTLAGLYRVVREDLAAEVMECALRDLVDWGFAESAEVTLPVTQVTDEGWETWRERVYENLQRHTE